MLFLIHTQPNTAVKSSLLHLFISYDSLCHATASWSKGINFGVESLVSNTSHHARGECLSVFLSHTSGKMLVTSITRVIVLLCASRDVGPALLYPPSFDVICFTTATGIKNGTQLQRAPGLGRMSRLGGSDGCRGRRQRMRRSVSVCWETSRKTATWKTTKGMGGYDSGF
jgi:hypothetical protein